MTQPLDDSLTSVLTGPVHCAAATLAFLLVLGNTQVLLTLGPLTQLFSLLDHAALRQAPSQHSDLSSRLS